MTRFSECTKKSVNKSKLAMIKTAVFTLLFICSVLGSEDIPEVRINNGVMRGKYMFSSGGRKFNAFTGVPFAKPPVGDLRFKAPIPAEPWEGILDASKHHNICPQTQPLSGDFSIHGNEDCLYLNVYTPQLPSSNKEPLPVIFYVHGGAFVFGSGGSMWYGPEILLDKDVVLVVPNYRLGALGFLSTGDEVVPGNNGLKDQSLALKWTKENVAAFGGNSDDITVIGHSAGGASSHYLIISPLSRDLMKRGIAQSGSALASWALSTKEEAAQAAGKLAKFLNCPTSCNHGMIKCLREASVDDILKQDIKFIEWARDPVIPFRPVVEPNVEGAFLPEHPADIIKAGKAANIPFMTGIATQEGTIKSAGYYSNPAWIEDFDKDFNRVAPISLWYASNVNKDKISTKIREFYFGEKAIDKTTKSELTDMYSDVVFLMGADETVRLHRKYTSPVYYYLFGYRGSESHSKLFGDPEHNYGVCHADELLYLFNLHIDFPNYKPTESDKQMSEVLTRLWYNFVKTGNPTPETDSLISTKWQPVRSDAFEYYFIKSPTDIIMAQGLYQERVKFWRDLAVYSNEQVRSEL